MEASWASRAVLLGAAEPRVAPVASFIPVRVRVRTDLRARTGARDRDKDIDKVRTMVNKTELGSAFDKLILCVES